ncbi:MAG: prepilin-type N-terminal cleavage/methylation domain-containing protein [Chitinivibrionales bacterium]|nr:prepilin-type N-terminal cleavage/methylation domain-containing protein [Chitinivibrionales bacterium]MBD3394234.1 prepilin-type N-terminal cleavage/methylation domain-containing protein [Chitinivibrionales bacterium]
MVEGKAGYTLLEVLVALTVFLLVLTPLLTRLVITGSSSRAADRITAACLLEQESALASHSPDAVLPHETRNLYGRLWTVKTATTGGELKEYQMKAYKGERLAGSVRWYQYCGNDE